MIEPTVFSNWLKDAVTGSVCVEITVGGGKYVVATVYGLVGFKGVFVFAVILVGGYFCIGAYLIGPD